MWLRLNPHNLVLGYVYPWCLCCSWKTECFWFLVFWFFLYQWLKCNHDSSSRKRMPHNRVVPVLCWEVWTCCPIVPWRLRLGDTSLVLWFGRRRYSRGSGVQYIEMIARPRLELGMIKDSPERTKNMREGGLDCPAGGYCFSCFTIFILLERACKSRQEVDFLWFIKSFKKLIFDSHIC